MDKKDFLLEIGCEELPTGALQPLSQALADGMMKAFAEAELSHESIQTFATPRRLAILVSNLLSKQPSRLIERQGPSLNKAYDKSGTPTLACIGFARSCSVSVDQLQVKKTPKGDRVFVRMQQSGRATENILPELVQHVIKQLPVTKPMRWSDGDIAFVRPVHWLVMLYGKDLVPTQLLGLRTTRETKGHRFHHPRELSIIEPKDYNMLLYSQGYVIADFETRKELIRKLIIKAAGYSLQTIVDDALLDEVTALVEWPVVLRGQFSSDYLSIPKEVLMTSMKTHQKYFAVEDAAGNLQPYFILVSNIESKDSKVVIAGNERVLNARLADAQFFYQNDRKQRLESRLTKLSHVVFQNQLGTLQEKSQRIAKLAKKIAHAIGENTALAERAGLLCKCDLVSEMVYEFPTLQGIMGCYYARNDQEPEAIALAIREHYLPRYSGEQLPKQLLSCAVALADRLDTLVGVLGINQVPTGDKDPFALRRAALGIIRILIEKHLDLDLMQLLDDAETLYQSMNLPNTEVKQQSFVFILNRLKFWYLEQNVTAEVFESVLACCPTNLLDFHRRIEAVRRFQQLPEANALAAANKRVSNILKKQASQQITQKSDATLFELPEEQSLAKQLKTHASACQVHYQNAEYTKALTELASLKEPIDAYFDHVMIMVDNERIRNNRLALLAELRNLFTQVADISLIG